VTAASRRVLVYTLTLLVSPMPAMPFVRGTRPFVLSLLACALMLMAGSYYAVRGEFGRRGRPLYATKMLIAAVMTLTFGAGIFVGSLVWLLR
jgi:hypothetical protein